jgi:hypothetical protein
MPFKKKSLTSTDAEALRSWKDKGAESIVLDARLDYTEVEGRSRYARSMAEADRIYPNMLPTQASGRWSTTDPPIVNFPAHSSSNCQRCKGVIEKYVEPHYLRELDGDVDWCPRDVRNTVVPDPGTWWLHFDLDGVEARLNAAFSHDVADLEAFKNKWDIHTLTACIIFHMDFPPDRTKKLHVSMDSAMVAWRLLYNWGGPEDRRRHIAKTIRYALQYGIDERAALGSTELYKMGLKRDEILKFGKAYLLGKPEMVATKSRIWVDALRTGVSYTFLGRRRRLYGYEKDKMKTAWSHKISGSVADMMNDNLIQITSKWSECYLCFQSHDGATISFPNSITPEVVLPFCKTVVEREWDVEGMKLTVPAEWDKILANGTIRHA